MNAPERLAAERERLARFRTELSRILSSSASPELREEWADCEADLRQVEEQATHDLNLSVALLGPMGTGKSSLINAVLGAKVLPTSATKACTSSVCEVSYSASGYAAEVEFICREDWEAELAPIRAELQDGEGGAPERQPLEALLHRVKVVYRLPEAPPASILTVGLPPEPDDIRLAFEEGRRTIRADSAEKLGKVIAPFLSSSGTFWPIVKRVCLAGPFAALESGLTLIDLPGISDPNKARVAVTLNRIADSRFVWVVFQAHRPPTQDIFNVLGQKKLFRDLLLDGKLGGLTFVGSKADDAEPEELIGELDLPPDSDAAAIMARRRSGLEADLRAILRDALSAARQASPDGATQLGEPRALGAVASFLVSAPAYVALGTRQQKWLDTPELTGIPQLRAHLDRIGRDHGVVHRLQILWEQVEQILTRLEAAAQGQEVRLKQQLALSRQQREEVESACAQAATFLDGQVMTHRTAFGQALLDSRFLLAERFRAAFQRGRDQVAHTTVVWERMKPSTLRSVCLNGGCHTTPSGSYDLPGDLVDPVLDSVAFAWDEFFGDRLLQIISTWSDRLAQLGRDHLLRLRESLAGRVAAGSDFRADAQQLLTTTERLLAEQLAQVQARIRDAIARTRGGLNTRVPPRIRAALRPAVAGAATESGDGSHKRRVDRHLRPGACRVSLDEFAAVQHDIEAEVGALQEAMERSYQEMTVATQRNLRRAAENFWRDVPGLSTTSVDRQLADLASLRAELLRLCGDIPASAGTAAAPAPEDGRPTNLPPGVRRLRA